MSARRARAAGKDGAEALEALRRLDEVTRRLRRECPWDREQDERSSNAHRRAPARERSSSSVSLDQPPRRLAQGELGIDAQLARGHHRLEEELTDEALCLVALRRVGRGAAGLVLP